MWERMRARVSDAGEEHAQDITLWIGVVPCVVGHTLKAQELGHELGTQECARRRSCLQATLSFEGLGQLELSLCCVST